MKLFAIGTYSYLNIDYIKEVWTNERKIFMTDGTEYNFSQDTFNELLEVLKPTMFGTQCKFDEHINANKISGDS